MRKHSVLLAVALLAFAMLASADTMQKNLYLSGSLNAIAGPESVKDFVGAGRGLKGGLGFQVSPTIEMVVSVQYMTFPLKKDGFLSLYEKTRQVRFRVPYSEISLIGGDIQVYGVGVDAKYTFLSKTANPSVRPYLVGGLGLMHVENPDDITIRTDDYDDLTVPGDDLGESNTDLLANVGVGVDLPLSGNTTAFLDCRYSIVFDKDDEDDGNTKLLNIGGGVKIGFGK